VLLDFKRIKVTLITLRATLPAQWKGALLAVASAACISVTFIASKQAMRDLAPLAFTPIWFAVASLWGIGFYLLRDGPKPPTGLGASVRPILLLGLLNGTANLLLFMAINLGDPTLAAFFSRSETIYSVFLGALLLGERMRRYQWLGVAVAIAGAGLITFRAGRVVWLMFLILLVSNFFLALSTLVAKKHITAVRPLILSTIRTIVMSVMLGLIGLMAGQLAWPRPTAWLWIIGGSFFGPFLSYVLFYKGLVYLDLAKGAVIRAMQPLFVAIYSLLLFGTLITLQQFMGGMLMIIGVVLMLWERQKANV
jgi:drug/metabolite transporter (DMT)-like permease